MIGDELHKITWYSKTLTVIAIGLCAYGFYAIGLRNGIENELLATQNQMQQDRLVASILDSVHQLQEQDKDNASHSLIPEFENTLNLIRESEPNIANVYSYGSIACTDCTDNSRHYIFYNHDTNEFFEFISEGVISGNIDSDTIRERFIEEDIVTEYSYLLEDMSLRLIEGKNCDLNKISTNDMCIPVDLSDQIENKILTPLIIS